MDVTTFLTARLDEDQAAICQQDEPESWCDRADGVHLAHGRALQEVAAKRAILALAEGDGPQDYSHPPEYWHALDLAVRELAAVYSDHPDYPKET